MEKIKKLFSTPGRAVATTLAAVLIVGILGAGIAVAAVYLDHRSDMLENRIEQEFAERMYADENSGVVTENAGDQAAPATDPASAQKISAEEAEDIALKDAGFARGDVKHLYSHFEFDDGFYQYDIHFQNGQLEYEYNINAEDGSLMGKDVDHIFD